MSWYNGTWRYSEVPFVRAYIRHIVQVYLGLFAAFGVLNPSQADDMLEKSVLIMNKTQLNEIEIIKLLSRIVQNFFWGRPNKEGKVDFVPFHTMICQFFFSLDVLNPYRAVRSH